MQRKRVKLNVYVDLDPVAGYFHTAESAQQALQSTLDRMIFHYEPVVEIEEVVQKAS